MNLIRLLPFLLTLQLSSGATISFSYLGLGEGKDALGDPFVFIVGGAEPGRLDFQGTPPTLSLADITHFAFSASLPEKDAFGNPSIRNLEFSDLLSFHASSTDGSYTNFTLVSEIRFALPPDPLNGSSWANGQLFRFSVMPDLTARLEAVSVDSTLTLSTGTISIIPEPSVLVLTACGLALLGARHRKMDER